MQLPPLIDTHTHLDFDQYAQDLDGVIDRAEENGVFAMLTIGIDHKTSLEAVKLAEHYEQVYAAVGVHPHDAKKMTDEHFDELRDLLNHPKVVAIGEVGLDYHYDYSPREVQRRVFRRFLDLSLDTQMPLIIHTREADEDMIPIVRDRAKQGWAGVFHCFAGDVNQANEVIGMGFLVSFTGNVTFKNSSSMHVAKEVPLDAMMVETDSPFMAPVPHRGRRNEPAYVRKVAEKIAKVKNVPVETVAKVTTDNALSLFNLDIRP